MVEAYGATAVYEAGLEVLDYSPVMVHSITEASRVASHLKQGTK